MNRDIQILARTIYGEARGEYTHPEGGLSALIAIGNVVMNRLSQQTWFGKSVIEVCQKPWQFSCWNNHDPNYPILMQDIICDPIYQVCYQVADKVISGTWPDLTGGCDHYHALTTNYPKWAQNLNPKIKIGRHRFYDLRRRV
jgi:spore germination cell wall hydrolase CwlJ-like protein